MEPAVLQRCGLPPGARPTAEQLRIVESALRTVGTPGTHVVVINAFAGSAKSSTVKLLMHSRPCIRMLYTAFNKAVVADAEATAPPHVTCSTTHKMAGVKRVELLNRGWQLKGLPYVRQLWNILPGLPYFQGRQPALHVAVVVRETLEKFTTSDSDVVRAEHLPEHIPYHLAEPPDYVRVAQQLWDALVSGAVPRTNRVSVSHNVYLKMFVADLLHPERGAGMELPGGPFDVILVDGCRCNRTWCCWVLFGRQLP